MRARRLVDRRLALAVIVLAAARGAAADPAADTTAVASPPRVFGAVGGVTLGEPLAVTVDFEGNVLVADGVPGRIVRIDAGGEKAVEFQRPAQNPGFYPTDVQLSGFFVYALDAVGRVLVRFDRDGAYRDQLVNFDEIFENGRVSPAGLDVDRSGRIAVTDERNHQIILFDSYLDVELVFGNYGSFPGQFDSPQGISFAERGGLLVSDSGNRRVQLLDRDGRFVRSIPPAPDAGPLRAPRRAVMGPGGAVYVADPEAGAVFVFDTAGAVLRSIVPADAEGFRPTDVMVTAAGIYVTDTANSSLYIFR